MDCLLSKLLQEFDLNSISNNEQDKYILFVLSSPPSTVTSKSRYGRHRLSFSFYDDSTGIGEGSPRLSSKVCSQRLVT